MSELSMGGHHEKAELPANQNQVSELSGDQAFTLQHEAPKESVAGSQSSQSHSSRILSPTELDWEVYQPSLSSDDLSVALAEDDQGKLLELPAARDQINAELPADHDKVNAELRAQHDQISAELPDQRYRGLHELASSHTIKRKPVELGSGRLRSTEVRGQTILPRQPKETVDEARWSRRANILGMAQGETP